MLRTIPLSWKQIRCSRRCHEDMIGAGTSNNTPAVSWEMMITPSLCCKAEVKSGRNVSNSLHLDVVREIIPLVTGVGSGLSILMLLLGRHGVPLLRLRVVPPSVVEKCTRVLYQLHISVSICCSSSRPRTSMYTYTHPNADDQ